MSPVEKDIDVISEINRKYFVLPEGEVDITQDFAECVRRLVTVLTFESIMGVTADEDNRGKRKKESLIDSKGEEHKRIVIQSDDKYHFSTLRQIHSILMDGLTISLRTLFYCRKGSKTAGSFIRDIAYIKDLKKANEKHLAESLNAFGLYDVGIITKKDIKRGYIQLPRYKVNLTERQDDKSFSQTHKTDNYIVVYDLDSSKAQKLAKSFFKTRYDSSGRNVNLPGIKEFEKFRFHKDRWPDGKRFSVKTETEKVDGINYRYRKVTDLCDPDFGQILDSLEDLAEIMQLYYGSCVSKLPFGRLSIYCNEYGSLSKMVLDICESFSIDLPKGFHNEVAIDIRNRIPKTISIMSL